jgi:protein TonB
MTAAVFTASKAQLTPSAASRTLGAGLRLIAALGLAGAITFSLFMVMQALIATEYAPEAEIEASEVILSFHVPELEPTIRPPRPDRVEPIQAPPPRPVIATDREAQPVEVGYSLTPPAIENGAVMSGVDQIVLPPPPLDTRVEPTYPAREASRGVQGDCTIRYDILASGRTANLAVVACDARGFERASLEAVARWRHAAARNGDPNAVVRQGVTTTLSYRLED